MALELTYRDAVEQFKYMSDRSGSVSGSTFYASSRFIVDQLLLTRASELFKLTLLGENVGAGTIQTINCIEMEEVDKADCPSAPPSGCTWLKSKCVLPKTIKIVSVTDITGSETFAHVDWDKEKYKSNSRVKSLRSKRRYTFKDTGEGLHIYVLNDCYLELISLSAIFEDPYCAATFCGQNKELSCNPLDTPFKTDKALMDRIIRTAWATLPQLKASAAGFDWTSDSMDNTLGEVQPKI